jgi:hypothetical protein
MDQRVFALALALALSIVPEHPAAQAGGYTVHLRSASVYDTGSGRRDTIYAALTVFVNGASKGTAIWDGRGWDGSRAEGREWDMGLHIFGTSAGSTVMLATGPVQDRDTVHLVVVVVNSSMPPSDADYRSTAERIEQSSCSSGSGGSSWDCLVLQSASLLAGWPIGKCEGFVAADKLAFTGAELREKTETGANIDLGKFYQRSTAPAGCTSNSIYGADVVITSD